MSSDFMSDRRRALEEEFFAKRDRELLERLRKEQELQPLAESLGIKDTAIVKKLQALNIGPETVAALSLFPLVEVAWADGTLEGKERQAVLKAAQDAGVAPGSSAYALLEQWLENRPSTELFRVWTEYIQSLAGTLDPPARDAFKQQLLDRARAVAEAAGGILGLGNRISNVEQRKLDQLAAAFEVPSE